MNPFPKTRSSSFCPAPGEREKREGKERRRKYSEEVSINKISYLEISKNDKNAWGDFCVLSGSSSDSGRKPGKNSISWVLGCFLLDHISMQVFGLSVVLC